MDRPIEPEVRRNRNVRRAAIAVLSIAAVIFLVRATVKWLRPSISRQDIELARVELVSPQDNLAAAASLKKSEIELAQLNEALSRARRTGEAQLASIASAIATLQRDRQESQRQLSLAMMGADRDGVITSIVED